MWFKGAAGHRKKSHTHLTERAFELLIIEAIKSGKIKPKIFEEPDELFVTATTRITFEGKHNKVGIRSIVSGGKTQ
jgi:hypothetical protein